MVSCVEHADEVCGSRPSEAAGELCHNDGEDTGRQGEDRRRPATG